MHDPFSERLTELRKERGFTQKEAAEQLGISGALLSHYEKGIRECGLSFLCKAAALYDVSCDYLLGVSNSRRGSFDETFDDRDFTQDSEFRIATLFRAAAMLNDNMSAVGAAEQMRNYFALAIYRAAVQAGKTGIIPTKWFTLPHDAAETFSDAVMDRIIKTDIHLAEHRQVHTAETAEPACVKTVITSCERILQKELSKMLSNSDT